MYYNGINGDELVVNVFDGDVIIFINYNVFDGDCLLLINIDGNIIEMSLYCGFLCSYIIYCIIY